MRKKIGVFGVNEEVLRLVQLLDRNPDIEIMRFFHEDRVAALHAANRAGSDVAEIVKSRLFDDLKAFMHPGDFDAVIDAGAGCSFRSVFPDAADGGLQILNPLTARLLWAYVGDARDRKAELLQALHEIVESVDLAVDTDELFARMLDIAAGATDADGGSVMLLDPERGELRIRVAHGVERELWPKIRVPLGEGVAGRVAADARSLLLRGRADASQFHIQYGRANVESALCVPLVASGRVLGVLNLHHNTREDAFDESDLEFLEHLATLDAQIIDRAQVHESLRNQAGRFNAVRDVQNVLASPEPILERLTRLCGLLAERVGGGIATVYLREDGSTDLSLAATSLAGGGFAGEYRVVPGQGIDGRVAASRRPEILRSDPGALAYACLPLVAGDEMVGIVAIQAGAHPPRGRAAEEILLEMAAAMAEGVARDDREARMAVRATRASAINEAGVRMISADDVNDVARMATSSAAMIIEAEHAVLRLQDPQTLRYVIRSYFGPADGRHQEQLFRLDKDVSVETIRRRTPLLLKNISHQTKSPETTGDVRSALTAPLKREGRVIGTLSVYDKVSPDRFYAIDFNDEDLEGFRKLVTYIERAIDNASFHAYARQHRNFDPQTGLPNSSYLDKRIREEIARANGRHCAMALAGCEIENLTAIREASNSAHVHRVIMAVADSLRAHLRDFDVLARTEGARFTALLPEPGHTPDQRIAELARAVAEDVCKDAKLNEAHRISLAFGYAVYPVDGDDVSGLMDCAANARIRMV
ncbi:MAG: GAF domain-containing protein [Myxococcota bacterium]|jgi:diguanylate cyclase (GGDEF)-like protein|nr:GAF domain-containing protein [Myxococcota bacterium]